MPILKENVIINNRQMLRGIVMAKQGVWGDRMRIVVPVLYKRVSCATCLHYCHEDHSCVATPKIPKIDGYDCWRSCKKFDLALEYYDELHKEQVIRIKGNQFFDKKAEINIKNDELSCLQCEISLDENNKKLENDEVQSKEVFKKAFYEQFIYFVRIHHNILFEEIILPIELNGKRAKCIINPQVKVIAIVISQIKANTNNMLGHINQDAIKIRLWNNFNKSIMEAVQAFEALKDSDEYEKWIVIPEITYKGDDSCGECFYKTKGSKLNGVKLVEMDKEGNILFATGPRYEKYWTVDKINKLQVFKEK